MGKTFRKTNWDSDRYEEKAKKFSNPKKKMAPQNSKKHKGYTDEH